MSEEMRKAVEAARDAMFEVENLLPHKTPERVRLYALRVQFGLIAAPLITRAATKADKRYSKEPCRKCSAFKVTVDDVDVSGGIDYVIDCDACGDHYVVDGPDA